MNERQEYALTHPLNDATDRRALEPLRAVRRDKKTGLLLMAVLAVDR